MNDDHKELSDTAADQNLQAWSAFIAEFNLRNVKLELSIKEIAVMGDSPFFGLKKIQIFRTFVAAYFITFFLWTWNQSAENEGIGYYWIYLTNWTIALEMTYLVFAATLSWRTPVLQGQMQKVFYEKHADDSKQVRVPRLVKITWCLQNLVFCSSLAVALLYWTLGYHSGQRITPKSPQAHGINFIIMALDMLLSGAPHRPMHFYFPCAYAMAFVLWSLIFTAANLHTARGDRFIYQRLDWVGSPVSASILVILVVFILIPTLHILLWWLVHVKSACRWKTDEWMMARLCSGNENIQIDILDVFLENEQLDSSSSSNYSYSRALV